MTKTERSLKELMNDTANGTEEEQENFKKLMESFSELGKSIKSYQIDQDLTNNTSDVLSERFYIEYFIMSAILEAFFLKDELTFKELNQSINNYVPKDFLWNVPVAYQNLIIKKMIRLGFIDVVDIGDKYNPHFKITIEGIKVYQEQIFQNLASSAFFSYQTLLLNKRTIKLNLSILRLTVLMLIVTVCSVIVTIFNIVI